MAMTLTELVSRSISHERLSIGIDRRVRRLAWLGLSAPIIAAGVEMWLAPEAAHVTGAKPHFFLFGWPAIRTILLLDGHATAEVRVTILIAGIIVALAVWTRQFTVGTITIHQVTLAASIAGILSPLPLLAAAIITLANLAVWVALVVVGAVLVFVVLAAILAGAGSSS